MEVQEANRRLEGILRASQREMFGKSSEKLSPDQFNLPLEDAELAQGVLEAAQEKAEAALARARGDEPRKPARNRGHLPAHLPRIERVIEPASTLCPCGCGEMTRIGEDVSQRLDPPRGNSPPDCFLILVDPGTVPGSGDAAPQICLSLLLAGRGAGSCSRARRAGRAADRTADRMDHRVQVRRPPSVLPPGGDLRAARAPPRPRHARQLGRPRLLPPDARDRPHEGSSAWCRPDLRR